jgi:2-polyprenyl-3-methyl-5-hydroxy-6-metoxy-1,4-benzoquinol methylase
VRPRHFGEDPCFLCTVTDRFECSERLAVEIEGIRQVTDLGVLSAQPGHAAGSARRRAADAMTSSDATSLREKVRDHHAQAARVAAEGKTACCGPAETDRFGAMQYTAGERASLPETSVLASLGCGNPTAVASLREGEVVLDLGSGGAIDVLLSARRVGSIGKVYGLDMTDEMLTLARHNAAEAGTPIRPPGVNTRNISANTADLSVERLMTQFEMTTSTVSAGRGMDVTQQGRGR